ncbi:hypothetical protein [Paraburkholderia sp. PGU19]|uniref:hypothetical protein n=1 Tax=Paraburkholderia sp. PGU19 TaxID=2735434 RepID=UPI0015DAD5B9|nr:hypothetical protein [Paraburkholderia sp. PGU19]
MSKFDLTTLAEALKKTCKSLFAPLGAAALGRAARSGRIPELPVKSVFLRDLQRSGVVTVTLGRWQPDAK